MIFLILFPLILFSALLLLFHYDIWFFSNYIEILFDTFEILEKDKNIFSTLTSLYGILFGFLLTSFSLIYSYRDNLFGFWVKQKKSRLNEFLAISVFLIVEILILMFSSFFLIINYNLIIFLIFLTLNISSFLLLILFLLIFFTGLKEE